MNVHALSRVFMCMCVSLHVYVCARCRAHVGVCGCVAAKVPLRAAFVCVYMRRCVSVYGIISEFCKIFVKKLNERKQISLYCCRQLIQPITCWLHLQEHFICNLMTSVNQLGPQLHRLPRCQSSTLSQQPNYPIFLNGKASQLEIWLISFLVSDINIVLHIYITIFLN